MGSDLNIDIWTAKEKKRGQGLTMDKNDFTDQSVNPMNG
jgi:hypothetical protein